jgi:hypothetical protein
MARIAPGIPHHITQRGDQRHGSGNNYGVPRIPADKPFDMFLGAEAERNERSSVPLYTPGKKHNRLFSFTFCHLG